MNTWPENYRNRGLNHSRKKADNQGDFVQLSKFNAMK